MPLHPFPDPGPDDGEPDGSPLPPAAAAEVEEEDGPGPGQGLFVCLPAEHLTLAGFAQGGAADTMPPGALLGTVVEAVTGQDGSGLPGCSDARCDLDHTTAWDQGGRTCECNLAPLCKR